MFKKILVPGIIILFLVAVGLAGYFYWQLKLLKDNPQLASQAEVEALVAQVSELIILPEGETPTVATVSDPELLREQAFFANAKAGDKVLLYTNAKKAILYDPIADKIVEVAPINIGQNDQAQAPTPVTAPAPTPEVAGETIDNTAPSPTPSP